MQHVIKFEKSTKSTGVEYKLKFEYFYSMYTTTISICKFDVHKLFFWPHILFEYYVDLVFSLRIRSCEFSVAQLIETMWICIEEEIF